MVSFSTKIPMKDSPIIEKIDFNYQFSADLTTSSCLPGTAGSLNHLLRDPPPTPSSKPVVLNEELLPPPIGLWQPISSKGKCQCFIPEAEDPPVSNSPLFPSWCFSPHMMTVPSYSTLWHLILSLNLKVFLIWESCGKTSELFIVFYVC